MDYGTRMETYICHLFLFLVCHIEKEVYFMHGVRIFDLIPRCMKRKLLIYFNYYFQFHMICIIIHLTQSLFCNFLVCLNYEFPYAKKILSLTSQTQALPRRLPRFWVSHLGTSASQAPHKLGIQGSRWLPTHCMVQFDQGARAHR